MFLQALTFGVLIANLAFLVVNFQMFSRLERDLAHVRVLDMLLNHIAARSFSTMYQLTWVAWASAMGLIKVEVGIGVRRGSWSVGADGEPRDIETREEA